MSLLEYRVILEVKTRIIMYLNKLKKSYTIEVDYLSNELTNSDDDDDDDQNEKNKKKLENELKNNMNKVVHINNLIELEEKEIKIDIDRYLDNIREICREEVNNLSHKLSNDDDQNNKYKLEKQLVNAMDCFTNIPFLKKLLKKEVEDIDI
jgi:rubrerythrin